MKKFLATLAVLLVISLVPQKETYALTTSEFSKSYQEMKTIYQNLYRSLEAPSDKVTLREFVSPDDEFYAGHLAGFYAFPYYSATLGPEDVYDGFNVGLGFSN